MARVVPKLSVFWQHLIVLYRGPDKLDVLCVLWPAAVPYVKQRCRATFWYMLFASCDDAVLQVLSSLKYAQDYNVVQEEYSMAHHVHAWLDG